MSDTPEPMTISLQDIEVTLNDAYETLADSPPLKYNRVKDILAPVREQMCDIVSQLHATERELHAEQEAHRIEMGKCARDALGTPVTQDQFERLWTVALSGVRTQVDMLLDKTDNGDPQ